MERSAKGWESLASGKAAVGIGLAAAAAAAGAFLLSRSSRRPDIETDAPHWTLDKSAYTKIVLKPDLPKGEILEVQEVEYADV